ncbi:MAG: FKBP-type peptidyl-prolyl cis-trans isomerase [Gemmataceae bacterium]
MAAKIRLKTEFLEGREMPAGLFATASSAGVVTAYDSTTWNQLFQFAPYPTVTGGVNVTTVDVNGDGTPDVVVAPKSGGGPVVKIYDGTNGTQITSFLVGDSADRSGVGLANAGKNASNQVVLAVGTVKSGVGTVEYVNAASGAVLDSFVPFAGFKGSLSVAVADVNNDGVSDVIVGAGAGGSPRVAVFNGTDRTKLFDAFAFETTFTGGVEVTVGSLNSESTTPDIIVSAGFLGGPRIQIYNPTSSYSVAQNFFAFDSSERSGVSATVFKTTSTGTNAIIATDGLNGTVAAFNTSTLASVPAPVFVGLPGSIPVTTTAPTVITTGDAGMTNSVPSTSVGTWTTLTGGVQYQDLATGSGTAVTSSSSITVYYSGYLTNGTVFDSARSPSNPATFPLSGLIPGWQIGLIGMKPGGIRNLFIPAALAYGSSGSGSIPPNADLYFQIKLVSVS